MKIHSSVQIGVKSHHYIQVILLTFIIYMVSHQLYSNESFLWSSSFSSFFSPFMVVTNTTSSSTESNLLSALVVLNVNIALRTTTLSLLIPLLNYLLNSTLPITPYVCSILFSSSQLYIWSPGYIDGTFPCPFATLSTDPNLSYTWYHQDSLILHAILSSFFETIVPLVSSSTSAHEAWNKLAKIYASNSRVWTLQLTFGLSECRHRRIINNGLTILLHQAHMPLSYWPFAFPTATYLINHLPTSNPAS